MGKHERISLVLCGLGIIVIYCVRYAEDPRDKAVRGAFAQGFALAALLASGRALYYILLYDADKVGQLDTWGALVFAGLALWIFLGWFKHDWRCIHWIVSWRTAPRVPLRVVSR